MSEISTAINKNSAVHFVQIRVWSLANPRKFTSLWYNRTTNVRISNKLDGSYGSHQPSKRSSILPCILLVASKASQSATVEKRLVLLHARHKLKLARRVKRNGNKIKPAQLLPQRHQIRSNQTQYLQLTAHLREQSRQCILILVSFDESNKRPAYFWVWRLRIRRKNKTVITVI